MSRYIIDLTQSIYVDMDDDADEQEVLERAAEVFNEEEFFPDECEIIDEVEVE